RYNGLITMREAVVNPANIYTVKLYQNAGVDYCWDFAKKNLGLDLKESEKTQLNNAIGAFGATPMEITRAYSAFPNLGTIKEPRCVTQIANADNRVLLEAEVKTNRAMKETTAYVVSDMMRSAVTDGNAKEAKLDDWYICGRPGTAPLDAAVFGSRTGTTDAWFAGYSPAYTAVVWTGYDTSDGDHYLSTEYGGEFGGSIPAGMWNQVMGKAHEGLTVQTSLTKPADVMTIKFDAMSGLKPVQLTPAALVKEEIGPGNGSPEGDSDVWIELEVDRNNPNLLAIEGVPSVLKTFLALERRFWSERELPYKPPTQFSSVLDIPRPNINGSYDPGVGGGGQRLLITFRTPVTNWSAFTAVVVLSSTTQGGTSRSIGVDMVNPSTLTVQINPQLTPQQDYQFYVYLRERATGREGGQSNVLIFTAT
ncbi:MAG: hypothetical protein LBB49_02660, partial [Gracilibacteraceae bacterium]|nr:hypothetical protein [Gracilibacteraceae bacterium]